ncbi:hypothetical protein [Shewanella sp. UCD-KL12]|uniref:hypothetical protein n=1 Tax=Shewanella sp. UCD-KL12 TaxID=1917163 RepID=UPI0009708DBA|nr:hypothetical protein [Shewanella sp. UCD-KL12]
MNTIPSEAVFEAFCLNSDFWGEGDRWVAQSLDKQFVIEGIVEKGEPVAKSMISDSDALNAGYKHSHRHLLTVHVNKKSSFTFAPYRASRVTTTHRNGKYLLLENNNGRKYAISVSGVGNKIVVLFKNEQSDAHWVLYEYPDVSTDTPLGVKHHADLFIEKKLKGYTEKSTYKYADLIKNV